MGTRDVAANNSSSGDKRTGEQEQPSSNALAVAGLAREVDALRQRVEPLDGLDSRVTELANTVADLANEVAEQCRRSSSTGAMSWLDLPDGADGSEPLDPDEVTRLLRELVVWVQRVYLRYADAAKTMPECWLWHPDVIEELIWLRHAWCCAYRAKNPSPMLAWDWHDRYRPGVVRRIHALAGRCSLDNHINPRVGATPTAPGLAGLEEVAHWWATNRASAPPMPNPEVLEQARAAESARLLHGEIQ